MQFQRSRPRHSRVIDPDGHAVDDTARFPRLHAVTEIVMRRLDPEPVSHLLHDGTAGRVLPVHGARTIVMRIPSAPVQRPARARDLVRLGFAMAGRQVDELVRVLSTGWRRLAAENDVVAARIDERLARMVERQHAWAAAEDGRLLAAAYAEGGTELVLKLTPTVLAAMDARANSGARS